MDIAAKLFRSRKTPPLQPMPEPTREQRPREGRVVWLLLAAGALVAGLAALLITAVVVQWLDEVTHFSQNSAAGLRVAASDAASTGDAVAVEWRPSREPRR